MLDLTLLLLLLLPSPLLLLLSPLLVWEAPLLIVVVAATGAVPVGLEFPEAVPDIVPPVGARNEIGEEVMHTKRKIRP